MENRDLFAVIQRAVISGPAELKIRWPRNGDDREMRDHAVICLFVPLPALISILRGLVCPSTGIRSVNTPAS